MELTAELLQSKFGISEKVLKRVSDAESKVSDTFARLDDIAAYNQYKVLDAFQKARISDTHFQWNTGYGYNDAGRDAIEDVYARTFGAEKALVRPLIVNGTHALSLVLCGILRPGDQLIYCTGRPYDTLEETIGLRGEGKGTLLEYGITYGQVDLTPEGSIDFEALKHAIGPATKMVGLQRSTGYGWRKAITMEEIAEWAAWMKKNYPEIVLMVDNCYGEFLDLREPTEVGVDIMAGSLIKNPGGGIALAGGYIAGRADLVDLISYRMTTPGIGGECGLTFGQSRSILQGLFMAPKVVSGAVKGAILCAQAFQSLGMEVQPKPEDRRSDIIEAVKLGSAEALIAFCQGVQAAAPVDSFVTPVPWDMPGYDDPVIMAAGAFTQGSSIELSADGPMRAPYNAYFQGGLTYESGRLGILYAAQEIYEFQK